MYSEFTIYWAWRTAAIRRSYRIVDNSLDNSVLAYDGSCLAGIWNDLTSEGYLE